jgi:phosphopantothenoylcysteine decarboxylase/phosphopantothenate--cysteine ligase
MQRKRPMQVLILSGPTHEYLDPVRFIGNASSGRMGRALAEEALQRNAQVTLITGPVADALLPAGQRLQIQRVTEAEEMLKAARLFFKSADLILFAAAVADYRPAIRHAEKLSKHNETLTLTLQPTPDLAATLCEGKREEQTAIGFALQTGDGTDAARRKLVKKNLDGIVLNTPASLNAPEGFFHFLTKGAGDFEHWGKISKPECARRILDAAGLR